MNMMITTITGALCCLVLRLTQVVGEGNNGLYYVGELETDHPSFVEILNLCPNGEDDGYPDLVITHFQEFGFGNGIQTFENIGKELENIANGNSPKATNLYDKTLTWPNAVYIAPNGIFAAETALIVHDGFLTPFHTNGGVYALLLNNSVAIDLIRLIPKTESCYYHNSSMIDLNNDGLLDILVAQSCQSDHVNTGKLLWLEQPASDANTPESWTIHELCDGPDILITIENITHLTNPNYNKYDKMTGVTNLDQTIIIYSSQFWAEKLAYFYLNTTKNGPIISKEYIIDDTIGPVYNCLIVDINKDGKNELLVNNHVANETQTGLWLYQFPNNWPNNDENMNETFNKIQIASGFNTTDKVGVGAPGFVYYFDLSEKDENEPYRIAVAGDGNYFAWQMIPTNTKTFEYNRVEIKAVGGTVGTLGVGDVNNDGYVEIFVPWYEKSKLYVYSANPDLACKKNCNLN